MNPIRILIVEDEIIIAEMLKEMAEELGHSNVKICMNYHDAIEAIHQGEIDMVLLDINLSDANGNGIDVAEYINTQAPGLPFIFITAYADSNTIQVTKAVSPYGYVLKPVNKDRLYVALELAWENASARKTESTNELEINGIFNDSFFIKDGLLMVKIPFEKILFIKSEGNYTEIYTPEKTFIIRSLLKDMHQKIPNHIFLRVHRSCIVNINKIDFYNQSNSSIRIGEHEISVGRTFKKEVQNIYQ